jgi:hypothetical protein
MAKKSSRNSKRRHARKAARLPLQAQHLSAFRGVDPESTASLVAAQGDPQQQRPRFEMLAYNGGRLHVKNFALPVVVDLSTLQASRPQYPVHLDHEKSQRVGHTDDVAIDGRTIRASGPVSFDSEAAREVVSAGREGFEWQASIGLRLEPAKNEFVPAGRRVSVNGRTFDGPVIVARQSTLNEISFVSVGGDEDGATARIAAEAAVPHTGEDPMSFEEWLASQGFDLATLSESQLAILKTAYDAQLSAEGDEEDVAAEGDDEEVAAEGEEERPNGTAASGRTDLQASGRSTRTRGTDTSLAARRRQEAAEIERIRRVGEICAQYGRPNFRVQGQEVSLEAHAVSEGWNADRTELEAMRQSRGSAAVHAHSHAGACTLEAMQGAAIVAAGVSLDHAAFRTPAATALRLPAWLSRGVDDAGRQRAMEAAHRFSQMSAIDICREAIRLDGRMIPSGRDNVIEAAFSGSALVNIWSTNVNARLLVKFQEATDSTRGWVQESDVADFRINERSRVKKGGRLTKHARGGSADHHSGEDTKEQYRIARYSEQIFVDEMDVIDDRLMALNDVIDEIALAAARLRPDLVYAILLSNPDMQDGDPLFATARSNLDETGAAMDATHIKEGLTRMALMQENGVNLNLEATHLVTAKTLLFAAQQVLNSAEVREPSATGGGTKNPLQGFIPKIESDSRIDNGVIDPDSGTTIAGDPTAFFLVAGNNPTIEVGYRQGSGRAPKVTTWKKAGEDGMWGMGASVNMDIGAKALAFQTMQKLTN